MIAEQRLVFQQLVGPVSHFVVDSVLRRADVDMTVDEAGMSPMMLLA